MKSVELNAEYAFSFGAYWMIYAVAGSFASVFMLQKGYDNLHVGTVLAASSMGAFLMQPFIADRMDQVKGGRIIDASVMMTLMMMLAGSGYFIFKGGSFMLAASIAVILALQSALQPMMNSLAFRLSESGVNVSFGLGRAGGSLGYSAILAVLGTIAEKKGVMALPVCAEASCLLLVILLLITKGSYTRIKKASGGTGQGGPSSSEEERIDLRSFIQRNKYFFIMSLGIAGLFFSNAVLSNYMPQIAYNVGGTTEQAGRILSLMALVEMPTMFLFDRIQSRFRVRSLIKLAALGFTAKIAVCWMAGSVGVLFAAQAFQLTAFALIMPAMVYFANEIMSPGEAIKGQALLTMMTTLGNTVASLAGGWILDVSGVKAMTFTALLVTAAGAVTVIMSADKVKSAKHDDLTDV